MRLFLLSLVCLLSFSAFAQDPVKPAAPAVAAPAAPAVVPVPAVIPAPAVTPLPVSDPAIVPVPSLVKVDGDKVTVDDLVTNATEVAAALKAYKGAQPDKTAARLGLMLLLAAVFKLLLSGLKFTSEFWKGDKGKLVLRLSTIVLGVGVLLASRLGAGDTWMNAMLLAVSGPLAISFHELFDIVMQLMKKKTPVAP
jgi:hypothetical protein